MARYRGTMAGGHSARRRTGRRRILCMGHRDEARRYSRARCCVLRDAAALNRVSDGGGLCQAERHHRDRSGPDRRWRLDCGQGYDREEKNSVILRCEPFLGGPRRMILSCGHPSRCRANARLLRMTTVCVADSAIRLPTLRRYLKRRKIKAGCDRAARQRPVAGAFGSLPCLYGDNGLRHFAAGEIGTESHAALAAIVGNLPAQRPASVVKPNFPPIPPL